VGDKCFHNKTKWLGPISLNRQVEV